jgi:alpha-glucuronidase
MGQASEMAYLGVRYEEVLRSDTYAKGRGSSVARVLDGTLDRHALTGAAGVANTGSDRNWSGSIFNQANWYAFGRFAWDVDSGARTVAEEWTRQTFGNNPKVVATTVDMMMKSYEAMIDYSMPLGLVFLKQPDTHYGPGMWDMSGTRTDWMSGWFNRAAPDGVGFDRTATGSNAVGQYNPPLSKLWSDPKTTPEEYLLYFHHVRWDYRLKSGKTLWEGLFDHYQRGVKTVDEIRAQWATLEGDIDPGRFGEVRDYLGIQKRQAVWWRDAGMAYFQSYSKLPYALGYQPKYSLDYYKSLPPGASPP